MKIPKEILSEANYEGSRLILITKEDNSKIYDLQSTLSSYQKELNPILDKLQKEYYSVADPLYTELKALQEKVRGLQTQLRDLGEKHKEDTSLLEAIEQKAQLVKNKIQPMILKAVEPLLGEFETAKHTVFKDDMIYVEVFDEIEETIKNTRRAKAKK